MRVVLGVGGQWSVAPWDSATIGNGTKRAALVKQYIDSAVLWGLDGLSLDVEYDGSVRNATWYGLHRQLLSTFACRPHYSPKHV